MKRIFLILAILAHTIGAAQNKTICVVVTVNGEITAPDKSVIKAGDEIAYENIRKLVPKQLGSFVTLFYPGSGTFRVKFKEKGEQVIEFAKEMLKLKAKSVSLSSRGECYCAVLSDCLFTDPLINEHLLIWDTITFPVDQAFSYYDSCFYFIQVKHKDRVYNKRLRTLGDKVILAPSDLEFNGNYSDSIDLPVTLGLYKEVEGKKFHEIMTRFRFTKVQASFINQYYLGLKSAMKDQSQDDIYKTFYTDLYIWYGKPDDCRLKQLIGIKTQ